VAVREVDTAAFDTWPKVLEHNSKTLGAKHPAMRYKHYGIWQVYTWADYLENVKYLALGLRSLGFEPGSKLLIVGDNSPQWFFAELAAQCNQGISVGVYSELSAREIQHVAQNSQAEFAMVEDQEQADKLTSIKEECPFLRAVVYWRYKGLSTDESCEFLGFRQVLEMGRAYEAEHPGAFEQSVMAGKGDDPCAIVYTSGTTGSPRGALHSYKSLMSASSAFSRQDQLGHRDHMASFLPPAWINEQWLIFGCNLLSGGTVDFAENSETQQADVRETAPTLIVYNSKLWESLAGQVRARLHNASRVKRLTSNALMPSALKLAGLLETGQKPGLGLQALGALSNLLVLRQVRDSLGLSRARVCYSSGSTLSPEAMTFFHALKVPLKNVYGSTEAGSVTGVTKKVQTRGTVGSLNPGIEVKCADSGEISVRHPGVFLGYYNDAEATAKVMSDGWVSTGDRCQLQGDELIFVDRISDLITLPCGDMVPPQEVESRLKYSSYIRDAWVIAGLGCDSLSAIIVVDAANTGHWADARRVSYTTFGDLSQQPEVYQLIKQEIALVNTVLPETQRITRYVNLHKEFDPDERELTRNRKLRRLTLGDRYQDLVKALVDGRSEVEVETEITYQDGRVGTLKTNLKIANIGQGEA
jgi:long-chain acyl-CoA synthetase